MADKLKRFLLVRTDRIGDVLLSVPAAASIKQKHPDSHITFLCRNLTKTIADRIPSIDETVSVENSDNTAKSFSALLQEIRAGDFDCAIVLHPDLKTALLLALAGIPVRIGTGYRAYSFLFNRRRKEHRKISMKHELKYNLGLLEEIGIESDSPVFDFTLEESEEKAAVGVLGHAGITDRFCIIHPGSGGSAMDWPSENYGETAWMIFEELGLSSLVTWGPGEESLARQVVEFSNNRAVMMPEVVPLPVLAAILKKANLIIAPSTGVLHLAVTVGTPVLGLYPSVPHMSPVRWGPYGTGNAALTPEIAGSDSFSPEDPSSMRLITPEKVISAAKELIGFKL